jgi:hypothetical protein
VAFLARQPVEIVDEPARLYGAGLDEPSISNPLMRRSAMVSGLI